MQRCSFLVFRCLMENHLVASAVSRIIVMLSLAVDMHVCSWYLPVPYWRVLRYGQSLGILWIYTKN